MNVNEQTVLMLGVLLVGIPAVLSLGSLIYESILNKREQQEKQVEYCCHECCGCMCCVEEKCGCCECVGECTCGACECECHKH